MQYNVTLLIFAVISLAILAWPFMFSRHNRISPYSVSDEVITVLGQKDMTYAQLADLEYDRQMGKVSEQSYRAVRGELLSTLSQVDKAEQTVRDHIAQQVEQELQCLRANEVTR